MKNDFYIFDRLANDGFVSEIPPDELNLATDGLYIFRATGAQVVDYPHSLAACNQRLRNMGANKTRPACY